MSYRQEALKRFAEVLGASISTALEAGRTSVKVEAPFVGGSSQPARATMGRVFREKFAHLDKVVYTDEYAEGDSFTLTISWEGEKATEERS